jgi:hypothetical protein
MYINIKKYKIDDKTANYLNKIWGHLVAAFVFGMAYDLILAAIASRASSGHGL